MSSGHEEQFALNNSKNNIKLIEQQLSNLREENMNSSPIESINAGVRVRTNPIVIPTITREEPKEINNYYNSVPTYSMNQNQTGIGGNNAAFAAILMVMEILALIILVTLITLVAFYGLS